MNIGKIFVRIGAAVTALVLVAGCVSGAGRGDGASSMVESLVVTARKPAFAGTSFGDAGPYEYVAGVATVRIDPDHAANRGIVDLGAAAGPDGWVRYRTDVVILRPVAASRASGTLVVEIANRGNKLALARLADAATQYDTAAQAGNGWFMRQGHSLAWIGWQGDVALGRQGQVVGTDFPVARSGNGPIVGQTVEEFVFDDAEKRSRAPLTYPAAEGMPARMEVRATPDGAATVLQPGAWRFVGPAEVEIDRPSSADGGAIYSLVYTAKDPRPMGLGMAAVRDVTLFLKGAAAGAPGAENPLADLRPATTVLFGISQSGRFLRDFIWQDFNRSPAGGPVFDAAMPIIAGSRKSFVNARFAQPGRYSRQHEDHFFPGDQFPFTYATTTDPVTGARDGIFARCGASNTCPKLMHLDSNLEFWQARASLLGVDGRGDAVSVPENVRFYLMGSTQHGPALQSVAGICRHPNNTAVQAPLVRAAFDALVAWAGKGRPPMPSRYPLSRADLAPLDATAIGFPDLAPMGIDFPTRKNELAVVDPRAVPFRPDPSRRYTTLLPRTNADGHDLAAVLMPDVAVPLATYSGWNLRRAGYAEGELCSINGIQIPLARSEAERQAGKDPRPSIAARYRTQSDYVQQVRSAANRLQADRFLLAEDAQRFVDAATREPRVAHLPR